MSLVIEQHSMRNPRAALHWYDFLCTRRDFEEIERFIYTLFRDACARSREDHVIGYLSCERCAAGVRDTFLRRRAQVSRQPRPEALSFGLAFSGAGQF
jgi:hypothetical protein